MTTAANHYQQAIKLFTEPISFEQDIDGYDPEKLSRFDYRDGYVWTFYRGDILSAISELEQAVVLEPDMLEVRILLANLLVTKKKYEQAIEHYQHAIRLAPDNLYLKLNYAVTLAQLGNESEPNQLYQMLKVEPHFQLSWLIDFLQLGKKLDSEIQQSALSLLEKQLDFDKLVHQRTIWRKLRMLFKLQIECHLCGKTKVIQYYLNSKTRWQVMYCGHCGVYFVFPQPTLSELNQKYVPGYFVPFLSDAEKILKTWKEWETTGRTFSSTGKQFSLVFQWLDSLGFDAYESQFSRNRKMLDIGCATCGLMAEFINRRWDAEGIEVSPEIIAFDKRMGFDVVQGPVEQVKYPGAEFNLITMTHVIEHLPNPKRTLQEIYRILAPNGKLFIRTPNCESIPRLIAGEEWFSDPAHVFFFGTKTLMKLITDCGFRILGIKNYVGIDMETYSETWNKLGLNDIIRARINQSNLGDVALFYAEKI